MIADIIISLLDFTRLTEDDQNDAVAEFCQKGVQHPIAALCVYPDYVSLAKDIIGQRPIALATVANFPQGTSDLATTLSLIQSAIANGANEIDVVLPYSAYLAGETDEALSYIKECKAACANDARLKVILETGAFDSTDRIYQCSRQLIELNVDFLKTSTGKGLPGASLTAARAMLTAIKDSGQHTGFKASGGIRTPEQAIDYIELTQSILGPSAITPSRLRIGASQLLDALIQTS